MIVFSNFPNFTILSHEKPYFHLIYLLSCRDQADEPAVSERLAGNWNSVEYSIPGDIHKGAMGGLNN